MDVEQKVMMRLSSQASVIHQETQTGVAIDGHKIWAKDKVQIAILNEIADHSRTIAELECLVCAIRDGPAGVENDALALVDFILTFGNAIDESSRESKNWEACNESGNKELCVPKLRR